MWKTLMIGLRHYMSRDGGYTIRKYLRQFLEVYNFTKIPESLNHVHIYIAGLVVNYGISNTIVLEMP